MSILNNPFVQVVGTAAATYFGGPLGALAAVSVFSQAEGQEAAEEQAVEAQKQAKIKNAVAGLQAQRSRSEMLRKQRIARGQVEAQGAVTGTQESSSVVGGLAGLQSTTAGNIGFSLASSNAGEAIFQSGQKVFDLEKKKGRADLISGVSNTLFGIGVQAKQGNL